MSESNSSSSTKTLEFKEIGPVPLISIPLPEGGGIVAFVGPNGSGKTELLKGVRTWVTGEGKLNKRDGADVASVSGLGATVTFRNSTRRSGELEAVSLDEGKFSIAQLVDPGFNDPGAADSARIKAILGITGVEADARKFYDLVGGETRLLAIVSPSALAGKDLVAMAAAVKRDIEAVARKREDAQKNFEQKRDAALEMIKGVDLDQPFDDTVIAAEYRKVVGEEAELRRQIEQYANSEVAADTARRQIVDQPKNKVSDVVHRRRALNEDLVDLRRQVAAAEQAILECDEHAQNAERIDAANFLCQKTIECFSLMIRPSKVKLIELVASEATISEQMQNCKVVREARLKKTEAEAYDVNAEALGKVAAEMRTAAHGCTGVLTSAVEKACPEMGIKEDERGKTRIVVDTDRGRTYIAELSHGERTTLALKIAIRSVGPGGLIPVEQGFFEGLDDAAIDNMRTMAREHNTWIVTARSRDAHDVNRELHSEIV